MCRYVFLFAFMMYRLFCTHPKYRFRWSLDQCYISPYLHKQYCSHWYTNLRLKCAREKVTFHMCIHQCIFSYISTLVCTIHMHHTISKNCTPIEQKLYMHHQINYRHWFSFKNMYLHNCILKRKVNLLRVCVHLVYCGETYFRLTSTKRKRNALSEMEKWREKRASNQKQVICLLFCELPRNKRISTE